MLTDSLVNKCLPDATGALLIVLRRLMALTEMLRCPPRPQSIAETLIIDAQGQ
jgi:hypothetical protein